MGNKAPYHETTGGEAGKASLQAYGADALEEVDFMAGVEQVE